jgi:hypothetical protein
MGFAAWKATPTLAVAKKRTAFFPSSPPPRPPPPPYPWWCLQLQECTKSTAQTRSGVKAYIYHPVCSLPRFLLL